MDKSRKLRRYNRKDYNQVVDFPVEIVGRDGVVRRYSFEESVRLYQRRIASAPSRYGDQDVAQAEMEHCQRRIDQLRRSYLERYGGSAARRLVALEGTSALAGEVTAFLLRTMDAAAFEHVQLDPVGALDLARVYAVRTGHQAAPWLLYVFPFDEAGEGPARDAFFAQVKLLQQIRGGGEGVETLLAFHHTADLGLVLTGNGPAAREAAEQVDLDDGPALAMSGRPAPEPREAEPAEAMGRLRRGDPEAALASFERAYERDPYRRSAYLGAAVVADLLGRFDHAALATEMGTRYLPDDPALAWHLAVARLRRGEIEPARQALARAQALDADAHAVHLLRALLALLDGRLRAGLRLLQEAARLDDGADPALAHTRQRLRLSLGALAGGRLLGLVGAAACLGPALDGSGPARVAVALALALALVVGPSWRAWLRRVVATPGRQGLRLASAATLSAAGRRADPTQ
ncbi:hypothetical protein L6R53_23930 [Myxococcota bacterium]|nr:hypothetical protein [Myxococcota bacterium]